MMKFVVGLILAAVVDARALRGLRAASTPVKTMLTRSMSKSTQQQSMSPQKFLALVAGGTGLATGASLFLHPSHHKKTPPTIFHIADDVRQIENSMFI